MSDRDGPNEDVVPPSPAHGESDTGTGPRRGTDPEGGSVFDPVRERFLGERDLQGVATWEPRSEFDRFAVTITGALRTLRWVVPVGAALALFLAQLVFAGLIILDTPLLGILAMLSVVPALALTGYLYVGDPTRREPLLLVAVTFLLSVLFASFAALVNTIFQPVFSLIPVVGLPLFFFLVVAPIEEFVKWLAIRVFAYRSDAFGTVVDGVVYGAVAGLGFAAIENLIYIITTYLSVTPADGLLQEHYAVTTAATRAFVGPGHVIFSAWAGFYLGLAKFNPAHRGPIVVKGLLIAVFIHALYNTLVSTLPLTLVTFFAFAVCFHGFWFVLLYRKIARYRHLYDQTDAAAGTR